MKSPRCSHSLRITTATAVGFLVISNSLASDSAPSPIDYVTPFIGTDTAGNTYPGAQAPFGMISISPNTVFEDYTDFAARPGYQYDCDEIYGFTLTHISGVGCHVAQDLPFTPVVGGLDTSPVGNKNAYVSRFSHQREYASPGYYKVHLDDYQTDVAISAAKRSSLVSIAFPKDEEAHLVFAPTNNANGITGSALSIDLDSNLITGQASSGGFCNFDPSSHNYTVYFAARFSQPIASAGSWVGDQRHPDLLQVEGLDVASYLSFDTASGAPLLMKIGISYVGEENALMNLDAEIPDWDPDRVLADTRAQWSELLERARVATPDEEEKTVFYTALYHNFLQPSIFEDVNGQYIGFDDQVHSVEDGEHCYANFSLWDTYRTTAQLQALLTPKPASDMVTSMLRQAEQGNPEGFPIWSLYNRESSIMNGYSALPFIANVYAFGGRDFDLQAVSQRMVWAANNKYRRGEDYIAHDYVPSYDSKWMYSVSMTLEYAIADFATSRICKAAGDMANYRYFLERSANSFNCFDPESGYMRVRNSDRSWADDFDPTHEHGFNEGNSAHYTWSVPHDLKRLVALIGGPDATESRLDQFFSKILIEGWHVENPYFWLANEPCFIAPFVYNWADRPWKSQAQVKEVISHFGPGPDGLPGDDDVGAMSAYYLFSAIGLYPVIPGEGGFTLTGPIFDEVELEIGDRSLRVVGENTSSKNTYIQSVTINGKPHVSHWIDLDALLTEESNTLHFVMGPKPNRSWGRVVSTP